MYIWQQVEMRREITWKFWRTCAVLIIDKKIIKNQNSPSYSSRIIESAILEFFKIIWWLELRFEKSSYGIPLGLWIKFHSDSGYEA